MKRLAILLSMLLIPLAAHATVTNQTFSVSFTCTGSTGPYPFTFPISSASAMTVTQSGTLLAPTAYTISPVNNDYNNGGSVMLNTACPSGANLILLVRKTPLTQTSVFTDNMPVPMKTIERGLDKLTEIDQELNGNKSGTGACLPGDYETADNATGPTCSPLPYPTPNPSQIGGTYYVNPATVGLYSNDFCDKIRTVISQIPNGQNGSKSGVVDATNFIQGPVPAPNLLCAVQPFVDVNNTYSSGILLLPSANILTSQSWWIPHGWRVVGIPNSTTITWNAGAFPAYPARTGVVILGDFNPASFYSQLFNLAVNCADTANSVGIYSENINELSGLNTVEVQGCTTRGILVDGTYESYLTGTLSTSGTAVTWVSGTTFSSAWVGTFITINNTASRYRIASVADSHHLTLYPIPSFLPVPTGTQSYVYQGGSPADFDCQSLFLIMSQYSTLTSNSYTTVPSVGMEVRGSIVNNHGCSNGTVTATGAGAVSIGVQLDATGGYWKGWHFETAGDGFGVGVTGQSSGSVIENVDGNNGMTNVVHIYNTNASTRVKIIGSIINGSTNNIQDDISGNTIQDNDVEDYTLGYGGVATSSSNSMTVGAQTWPPMWSQNGAMDIVARRASTDVYPAGWLCQKARGSLNSLSSVIADDGLCYFEGMGWNATDAAWEVGGQVQFEADGTPGAGSMPGRASIYTTPTGSIIPLLAARFDKSQNTSLYGSLLGPSSTYTWIPKTAHSYFGSSTGSPLLCSGSPTAGEYCDGAAGAWTAINVTASWTPVATGYTVVGSAPTLTGSYTTTGHIVNFNILMTCTSACTSVASVGNTSYITLPGSAIGSNYTACAATATAVSLGCGVVNGGDIYTPTWTAVTGNTIAITGWYQI